MNLFIIRHADAGDSHQWAGDDSERPFSLLGLQQARALGSALHDRGIELQATVSSPLVRTRQTAEEVLKAWSPPCPLSFSDLLAPGELRKRKLAKQLAQLGLVSIAIVGHDPDLPAFLGWLLGVDPEHVPLKKGGAAAVSFEEEPGKGDGNLDWLIAPEWYMKESGA
jgi:phosphohistidine phosphatase